MKFSNTSQTNALERDNYIFYCVKHITTKTVAVKMK